MYKIAFCVPSLGRPTLRTWNSFNNLVKPRASGTLLGESHFITIEDRPIESARQWLTRQALSVEGLTHIMWIDDDMEFPPDALEKLLAHDKPIVGGLCFNRRAPAYQPIVARKYDEALGMPRGAYGFVYDLPRTGLVECDATGGAFLLVKVEVFKAVTEKFGSDSWWEQEGEASEDFSFCARAKACGYGIFVDCGITIGHSGTVIIDRTIAEKLRTANVAAWLPIVAAPEGGTRVSVIIPTYNQKPSYLKAAVLSALNQTVATEVIVVDDGTTDYEILLGDAPDMTVGVPITRDMPIGPLRPTVWISKRARLIKHLRNSPPRPTPDNRGISAALNTGIAAMSTDYFCWLSSDDLFAPNKVERQLAAMIANGAKASFHDYTVIDNTPESFGRYVIGPSWNSIEDQLRQLRATCCINGSTVMIRRDVFTEGPGPFFDPELRFAQDWDAWLKVATKFLWLRIPESLGVRREGENLTAAIAKSPESDERRRRRDEEDEIVRARYQDRKRLLVAQLCELAHKVYVCEPPTLPRIRAALEELEGLL